MQERFDISDEDVRRHPTKNLRLGAEQLFEDPRKSSLFLRVTSFITGISIEAIKAKVEKEIETEK